VITVTPETTIGEAAQLMLTHAIAGLPVISAGKVVGILTESDIFRMVGKLWDDEENSTSQYAPASRNTAAMLTMLI
jgi:CBS domain-containing protein